MIYGVSYATAILVERLGLLFLIGGHQLQGRKVNYVQVRAFYTGTFDQNSFHSTIHLLVVMAGVSKEEKHHKKRASIIQFQISNTYCFF